MFLYKQEMFCQWIMSASSLIVVKVIYGKLNDDEIYHFLAGSFLVSLLYNFLQSMFLSTVDYFRAQIYHTQRQRDCRSLFRATEKRNRNSCREKNSPYLIRYNGKNALHSQLFSILENGWRHMCNFSVLFGVQQLEQSFREVTEISMLHFELRIHI